MKMPLKGRGLGGGHGVGKGPSANSGGRVFNGLTVGYLFLGGTGGGALVVLCLIILNDVRRGFAPSSHFPRQYGAMAWTACLLLLVLGVVCLLADMGNPARAWGFLFAREFTVATGGSWGLLLAVAVSFVFWVAFFFDTMSVPVGVAVSLAIVGVGSGLLVTVYTGVLLQTMVSVLAWGTPLVAVLFCLSSLSCGIAVALAFVGFTSSRFHLMNAVEVLLRVDRILIVLELTALAAYIAWLYLSPSLMHFAQHLTTGRESALFWLELVGFGLVVPLILERSVTYANHRSQLLFAAACVLAGGLALRICMVGLFPLDVTQAPAFVSTLTELGAP